MERLWKSASTRARQLWQDQNGDMVQNLGWLIAVSIGVAIVGGLIWTSTKGVGDKVNTQVNGWNGAQ